MNRVALLFKPEHISVVHVHLVYEEMLTQIANMCEIFNLGVPDRGEQPLYKLVREAIAEEEAICATKIQSEGHQDTEDIESTKEMEAVEVPAEDDQDVENSEPAEEATYTDKSKMIVVRKLSYIKYIWHNDVFS